MNKFIVLGSVFTLGVIVGNRIRTNAINKKLYALYQLTELVKKENNKYLSNVSDLYSKLTGTEGKFTEFDEYISSMWME